MQDTKKLDEPGTPATPVEDEPQHGGFGALADVYRPRWAATQPNMRAGEYTNPTIGTGETTPPEPDPRRLQTEDGTRLFHAKDPSYGSTGRLELREAPGPGQDRQVVPDAIPYDVPEPVTPSSDTSRPPRYLDGRFGNQLAMVSWRSRMRWLDDGGR